MHIIITQCLFLLKSDCLRSYCRKKLDVRVYKGIIALFQSQNVVILYHPEPTVELIFTFLKHLINIL